VLILNQSYEPLTICNIKKAVILMYLGKAELVLKDDGKAIRSIYSNYPWPSVIRLSRFVRVPYKKVVLTRKNILRRDGYKCAYCGRGDLTLTIDHIIPKARGGDDAWENLVSACTNCNNQKGDRTPHEAGLSLLVKPFKPSHIMFIKNVVGRIDDKWKPYLYLS
jgi:5-methylcytosine-specific restriction endonuclease McrA